MSDVTQLIENKITLPEFIAKVAAEFNASPFKALVPFALMLLQIVLSAELKSPTMAALIINDIQSVMNGNASALTSQVAAGSVALVQGLVSGQSGSLTGQQVEQAVQGAGQQPG